MMMAEAGVANPIATMLNPLFQDFTRKRLIPRDHFAFSR
jgi:hypothetical protein